MKILIDRPKNGWSHLVAETLPDLHAFARKIGVKRHLFENKRHKNKPHYDIKQSYFKKAIAAGAIVVESRIIINFLKENYKQ